MAIISIGDRTLNFKTREPAETDSVQVNANRGRQFFITELNQTATDIGQYVLIVPKFVAPEGIQELKPCAKFFPKGATLSFFVPVPAQMRYDQTPLSLLLYPLGRRNNNAGTTEREFRVEFDDGRSYALGQVVLNAGV